MSISSQANNENETFCIILKMKLYFLINYLLLLILYVKKLYVGTGNLFIFKIR